MKQSKKVKVTFRYRDQFTDWEWITHSCIVENVKVVRDYLSNQGACHWGIISVEEVKG